MIKKLVIDYMVLIEMYKQFFFIYFFLFTINVYKRKSDVFYVENKEHNNDVGEKRGHLVIETNVLLLYFSSTRK